MKIPKSSIVLLAYNHFLETTKPCLLSLIKHTDLIENELIIVDNCSSDNTVNGIEEIISSEKLNIRLIKIKKWKKIFPILFLNHLFLLIIIYHL